MLRIYQIGNFRVNLVPSSKQGLVESYPTSFRRPSDVLTGRSGDIVYATPGKPLVTAGSWSFEGAIICEAGNGCESVTQEFNRMIASGGEVVNIIAAIPAECCPCDQCGSTSGCTHCSTMPEAQWLLTCGMVTEFKPKYDWEFNQDWGTGEINVSLTIVGPTHWEPLNDVEWKYYGRNKPIYPTLLGSVAKNPHPFTPRWGGRSDSGFQKIILDGHIMWDPANWILGYSSTMNRRARAVLTSTDYTTPTVTVPTGVQHSHLCDIPYANWPAQPQSLYYFSNLQDLGSIALTVDTLTPHGQSVTSRATLDLDELATVLDEYGASPADSIIVGMLNNRLVSLYLDAGTTPLDIYVPWVYTGGYPGETLIGYNTITVDYTQEDAEIEFAYLHIFRRY